MNMPLSSYQSTSLFPPFFFFFTGKAVSMEKKPVKTDKMNLLMKIQLIILIN